MGQFALGIRSLLIKTAIFVIMAALLAWALGGTLWPRPSRVQFYAGGFQGKDLCWVLEVHDGLAAESKSFPEECVQWRLVSKKPNGKTDPVSFGAIARWYEVAGPLTQAGDVYFGGCVFDPNGSQWFFYAVDKQGIITKTKMPDRLAVEQQLARLAAGLPLQDAQTILQQRAAVLDPKPNPADQH